MVVMAEMLIANGRLRKVERREAIDIKRQAEENGLATFLLEVNLGVVNSGTSCSCCGDCCYALRTVNEFNKPGIIAPPHFQPVVQAGEMHRLWTMLRPSVRWVRSPIDQDTRRVPFIDPERCIGCGLVCGEMRIHTGDRQ